jgi:20S proteasome alpha/beta subunit
MPLIIAIPGADGVALASDTELRVGAVRESTSRIHSLNNRICWSAIGEEALIQRIQQGFSAFERSGQSLRELAVPIGNAIKTGIRDFLAIDFRTDIYVNNINAITQLHRADFVFVESIPSPLILHMSVVGSPQWVHAHPYIIGSGDAFAAATLKKYRQVPLDINLASILAYRAMDETIESGTFNLNQPMDIWQITQHGNKKLLEKEIEAIADSVETIRRHELAVFEKHLTMTVSH